MVEMSPVLVFKFRERKFNKYHVTHMMEKSKKLDIKEALISKLSHIHTICPYMNDVKKKKKKI